MARKKPKPKVDVVTTLGAIGQLAEMPELIRKVSESFATAQRAGLTERLLVLLLSDTTKVSKTDVRKVLEAIPLLYDRFCKEPDL